MFICRTQTRRAADGSSYSTCRLVRSERRGDKVRQRTLLNLGRHFEIESAAWLGLCARIEDLLDGQQALIAELPETVETEAQRIAALLLARGVGVAADAPADSVAVHPDSMALARPRSVGVEQAGLWALEQVGLMPLLEELGVNGALRAAAAGLIVGRMAHPASERETHRWLGRDSGLGELLGVDYEAMGAMQLYRASDALVKHRHAIEARLYEPAMDLFGLSATVTLFDLTNTYFEGDAAKQPLARHSKEQRDDRPLPHAGSGAGRLGLREPLADVRRQRARAHHAARHAGRSGRTGRCARGHGPGPRHRGADRLAAGVRLPLSGRQPQAPAVVRRRRRRGHRHGIGADAASGPAGLRGQRRSPPELLLRGTRAKGARHGRAPVRALVRAAKPPSGTNADRMRLLSRHPKPHEHETDV